MGDGDARRLRHRARQTAKEGRPDTIETKEERANCAHSSRANLLRRFRRISAARTSATQRPDYGTQVQSFRSTLSQCLQSLRTAKILAEQKEEDVAAETGRLTDGVIADQEEGNAAAEEHRRPPEQDTGRTDDNLHRLNNQLRAIPSEVLAGKSQRNNMCSVQEMAQNNHSSTIHR